MEDELILDLFFSRDERAISETDSKYGGRLCSMSANITGSRLDAEECVNDTYTAAWNSIPPQRPENYYAYLCRIVRNLSYNRFHRSTAKKRRAVTVSLEGELEEILPDPSGGFVSSDGDAEALGRAIDSFLRKTDKELRIIFIRRYFYADSLESLSTLTGISRNALSLRLMRMRRRLRDYLKKEGFNV